MYDSTHGVPTCELVHVQICVFGITRHWGTVSSDSRAAGVFNVPSVPSYAACWGEEGLWASLSQG